MQFYCNLHGHCKHLLTSCALLWRRGRGGHILQQHISHHRREYTTIAICLSIATYVVTTSCQQRSTAINGSTWAAAIYYIRSSSLNLLMWLNGVDDTSTIRPLLPKYNFMSSSICNNQVINYSSDSAASNHCNLQILFGKEQPFWQRAVSTR